MGRLMLAGVLAAALVMVGVPGKAAAIAVWCEDDPPVVIETPAGGLVTVWVTNGVLGVEHLPAAQLARISYSVESISGGTATRVTMGVVIPGDLFASRFATRSVVSTLPARGGTVLADADGHSGESMRLKFVLDVP